MCGYPVLYAGGIRYDMVEIFLGDEQGRMTNFLRIRGADVHDSPQPLSDMMRRASIVVSHGGSGVTHAAIVTGRPQLVLSNHLETGITAARIEALGAGIAPESYDQQAVAEGLERLLDYSPASGMNRGLRSRLTPNMIRSAQVPGKTGLPARPPAPMILAHARPPHG